MLVAVGFPAASRAADIRDPVCTPAPCERRAVDVVICLDTSGSMTDLIDSARARLWDIVSTLSKARPMPRLRVGLLTYGSPSNSTGSGGWIVKHTDLTDDLDVVYSRMMGMHTDGGDEFVGWVLHDAVESMSWSNDPRALRIIFVAGNESADQARERHDFRYVAEKARNRGILINSIYAGSRDQGVAENWHLVAQSGGGNFNAIDMKCGTVQVPTPYDDTLRKLNDALNSTYLPYGVAGREREAMQRDQDGQAMAMGPQTMSSRAAAKAGALYQNSVWDLVDASNSKDFDLDDVPVASLPGAMQSMNPEQRVDYLKQVTRKRGDVQREIQETDMRRQQFLQQRLASAGGSVSLDQAILASLRSQAEALGFQFADAPENATSNGAP
jgi:hypothetical protein